MAERASAGLRSMISDLRVGSPNSLRPRTTKTPTNHPNDRLNNSTRGNTVKKPKVARTNGLLARRAAAGATGRYTSTAVAISMVVRTPNWTGVTAETLEVTG